MKSITLNFKHMTSRDATHDYLEKKLKLPDYYGRNLDALFDCLTEIGEPTTIIIKHRDRVDEAIRQYTEILVTVFMNACEENENLTLQIIDETTD